MKAQIPTVVGPYSTPVRNLLWLLKRRNRLRNNITARDLGGPLIEEFVTTLARRIYKLTENGQTNLYRIVPLHTHPPDY